uniref:Proopiomelanocortin n=1 Tax=Labrus bergylta TaxID=56723 RepID=A0A3Q3N440_9LABR
MCPVWLLVAVVVVGRARGAVSQCWEHPSCQDLNSESSMMDCIQLCRSDLTAETPVIPGDAHLQPPPEDSASSTVPSSSSSPQTKRSYSMEHFRWGKPVGRKRRPVKVYTSNGVEEESDELQEVMEEEEQQQQLLDKKDGTYKMKHFRWSGPPESKRYEVGELHLTERRGARLQVTGWMIRSKTSD